MPMLDTQCLTQNASHPCGLRAALDAGLAKYESVTQKFGRDGVDAVAPRQFTLLVADSMLARDRIVQKLNTQHEITCNTYQ